MTYQTDREIDAIRERQDAAAIDAKYAEPSLEERQQAEEREAMDHALWEVLQIAKAYRGGTLDYTEAAGVLTTYLPQIVHALTREVEAA